jgi:hypothetical protein
MGAERNLRIGIIGAGAGGLSVAEALKDKGYTNIVVFEKRDRAGGQVYTWHYRTPDNRTILCEMGSVQPVSAGVGAIHRLIKRYDLHFGRTITEKKPAKFRVYSAEQRAYCRDFTRSIIGFPLTIKNLILFSLDVSKLSWYLIKYHKLARPGYTNLSDKHLQELSVSKEKWVDGKRFFLIGEYLKYFLGGIPTLMNAEIKTISAVAIIKILLNCLKPPVRYVNGTYLPLREGFQELWTRVAANHEVHYDSEVKKVIRKHEEVVVSTKDSNHVFDKIVITSATFELVRFLELTDAESDVFSKVRYAPGWRAAFLAKNLPHDAAFSFYEACTKVNFSPPLSILCPEGQVDADTWLYGCVISVPHAGPIEPILKVIDAFLREHFGGEVCQWLNTVYWPQYGPFFPFDDVANGIYQKVEGLQGRNNTYYAGDVISGFSNAVVADYAYDLVERFF